MPTSFRVAVLISGRGSNLAALISGAKHYAICGVVANNPSAAGLRYARDNGIPNVSITREDHTGLQQAKDAVMSAVEKFEPDLVVLAGYMWIVQPEFVTRFQHKMLNIHPSLLPKFPGLDTHKKALDAGEREHGCTVHLVSNEVDGGRVIAQASVPVLQEDSEEALAARVLEKEHQVYPWVVGCLATGAICISQAGDIEYSPRAKASAAQNGFRLP